MDGLHQPAKDDLVWTDGGSQPPGPPSPTSPVATSFGSLPMAPEPAPKRRLFLWVGVAVIALLLGGGGVFAYTRGWIPTTLLGGISMDTILDGLTSGQQSNSGSATLTVSINSGPRDADATQFPLEVSKAGALAPMPFTGVPAAVAQTPFAVEGELPTLTNAAVDILPLDETSDVNINALLNVNGSVFMQGPDVQTELPALGTATLSSSIWDQYASIGGTLTADLKMGALDTDNPMMSVRLRGSASVNGTTYPYDVEGRLVDKRVYLQATALPTLPVVTLQNAIGKWYVYDVPATFMEQLTQNVSSAETAKQQAEAKKILDAVRAAQKETKFLFVEKVLGSETIAGIKTKRVRLGFKPEKLRDFYAGVRDRAKAAGVKWPNDVKAEQALEAALQKTETVAQIKAYAANATHDVWVDPKSGRVLGAAWSLRLVPPDSVAALKDKQVNIGFDTRTVSLDASVTVDAPTATVPMTQLLNDALGSSLAQSFGGGTITPGAETTDDLTTDTDADGLPDVNERVLFGTDPTKADTDGDGYSDKTETDSGHDPLNPPATAP